MNGSAQEHDLSGEWQGSFEYPRGLGPSTPFVARLAQFGSQLSGTIIEPNTIAMGNRSIEAVVSGLRSGLSVDFTKTYIGREWGYENPVDYVGQLTDDGLMITGIWSLLDMDGKFELYRDKLEEAAFQKEVEEVAPIAR